MLNNRKAWHSKAEDLSFKKFLILEEEKYLFVYRLLNSVRVKVTITHFY